MYAAWLFFGDHFKDVFFPDTESWTSQIVISQDESGWSSDSIFQIRALDGNIFLSPPASFLWVTDRSGAERQIQLEEHNVFFSGDGEVTIILKRLTREHLCFSKYLPEGNMLTIGRSPENNICDMDQRLSLFHGYITFTGGTNAEYSDQSSNGTYLNGRRVMNNTVLIQYGDVLTMPSGLKLIYLNNLIAINRIDTLQHVQMRKAAALQPLPMDDLPESFPSLYVQYHRAPRMLHKSADDVIQIEPPLAKQDNNNPPTWLQLGPSMTMVLPMLMGTMLGGMGGAGRLPAGLIMVGTSSVLAVIWGLINRRYRDNQATIVEGRRVGMYQQYIAEMEQELRELNNQEFQRLTGNFPNVGECLNLASDGTYRLWNRMPTHPDFLNVRIGLGTVPLPSEIGTERKKLSFIDDPLRDEADRLKKQYSVVHDAPVVVALRKEPVVGILGGEEATMFAQGLLMQIAALHSYHDVRIAVFAEESAASQWAWARWLPHVFASEDRQMRMVVSTPSAIHDVMNHIGDIINMRRSSEEENDNGISDTEEIDERMLPLPHHIIFCTNARLLENETAMRQLLTNHLGITLVMIANSMELLPKECHLVFNVASRPGFLHTSDGDTTQVDFEYPNRNLLLTFARNIAPLRVKDAAENAAIPTLVSFLDIYGVRRTSDLDVWRMWSENHTYDGLRSVIGYTAGSQPFVLDISEKYHGPHGLIAGTTGSGKSVMLQTYILSLALNYSPTQVQFILIDYKGGGMADAFRNLPHTAGIIDNLQGDRVISRALASLNGEIHRREVLFQEVGVKDIIEYTKLYGDDPNEIPLPHLIIITDEFAELKSDQPEFMKELVSASRVGRSLGIHLILATQKPSASVSDEIWANSRFHLCLRVQTVADSRDMLKRPDAAYIKGTGRCFIQIGNDESFDQVQTSYAGMPYNPNEPRAEELPQLLSEIGQTISPPKRRKQKSKERVTTQMEAVLERINEVAESHGIKHQRQMWLPELPEHVYFSRLSAFHCVDPEKGDYKNAPEGVQFLLGLADDTARQRYVPYVVNLSEKRNLLLVGLSGSGKTTAVQSIVYSLVNQYDPAHLNIYVLSLTSRTLENLRALPHVGDVVFEDEVMEVKRLVNLLEKEEQRRSDLFSAAATDSFIEYNRAQEQAGKPIVPAIVVFIDRFEQIRSMLENDEAMYQRLFNLLREGSSRGIHFIATAMAKNELPYKLHPFFAGIALQQNDRSDYSDVINARVPIEMPQIARNAGRALVSVSKDVLFEIQVGLAGFPEGAASELQGDPETGIIEMAFPPTPPLTDSARADQLKVFAGRLDENWQGPRPAPVPRVPADPTWDLFSKQASYAELQKTPFSLPLGYDLTSGEPAVLDLEEQYGLFVTGPKRSGKTNLMMFLARLMLARGAEVHVIGDTEWATFAKETGVHLYSQRQEIIDFVHSFQETILADRSPKKRVAKEQGKAALHKLALELSPYTIIVDNAQRFNTDFNELEMGEELKYMRTVLSQMCARADHYNIQLFFSAPFTAQTYFLQEPLKSLIAHGCGVSMGGKVNDCNPLGIANLMPSTFARAQLPMGQGYLIFDGKLRQIVVPLSESVEG